MTSSTTTTTTTSKPATPAVTATESKYAEDRHTVTVKKHVFDVEKKYEPIKFLGKGAYGIVISATDSVAKKRVAIKMIPDWSGDWVDGLRILREVKLLRHFAIHKHPNIIELNNIQASALEKPFEEVYVIMDYMDTDMHKIIYSKNPLSEQHLQSWIHSSLKALKFLHSGNIIHRDLKPSNLLLNRDCSLKLCDFGLARGTGEEIDKEMTEYVVTRWYRAPELMCGCEYGPEIDVWALGCILAELIMRKPLFPGKDYKHQFELMFEVFGTPSDEDLDAIENNSAKTYLKKLAHQPGKSLVEVSPKFASASKPEIDLMKKMLQFNPKKRISVEDALDHVWIRTLGTSDADLCPEALSFEFESSKNLPKNDRQKLKEAMWALIREVHPDLPQDRVWKKGTQKKKK